MMMTAPSPSGGGEGGGEGGSSSPETTEGLTKQDLPQRCFGTLDLAGHAVSARPGRPRLRLQVLGCQNLSAADLFGKSDPCVLVFWDGVEVGRTSIARDNLNPSFSVPENTFQLPLMPPMAAAQPHLSNRATRRERRSSTQTTDDWSAYAPTLRLEVWDMDRDTFSRKWGKGELLGEVSLRGPCGIVPVIQASSTAQCLGLDLAAAAAAAVPVDVARAGVTLKLSANGRVAKEGLTSHAPVHSQESAGVISINIAVESATDDSEAWVARAGASSLAAAVAAASASANAGRSHPMQDKGMTVVRGSVPSEKKTVSESGSHDFAVSNPSCFPPHARGWLQLPHLRVRCLDARRLPLGCDGYCRVFWNGRQVGRTSLASAIAHDVHGLANSSNPGPVVSSFQRNPVWWTPLTTSLAIDGSNSGSLQTHSESSAAAATAAAVAVVPLYEDPTGDRLTLEVFDGSHLQKKAKRGGEHESPVRDGLGRSLGSATIFGERLISPPRGRVGLELSPTLPGDKSAAGISLSISLERLSHENEEEEEEEEGNVTNGLHEIGPRGTNARPRDAGARPQETGTSRRGTNTTKRQDYDNDGPVHATATTTTTTTATSASSSKSATEETGNKHLHENIGGGSRQRPKLWLRLQIEGGRLLHGMDLSGTSDPYCQVYVDRVWYSKTGVCWGTLTPRWGQSFEIEIAGRGDTAVDLGWDHEIRVELWDKDVVGADDFIGECNLLVHKRSDG